MSEKTVLAWAMLAIQAIASVAFGQADDQYRIILHTKGPAATTRALGWSPDSTRFYAAGRDKVIHSWRLVARDNRTEAVWTDTLRWEFARGHLGTINCIAVSPNSNPELIAVGGTSARDRNGIVVLINPATRQIVRALPDLDEFNDAPKDQYQEQIRRVGRHLATIGSLHFSPSGKWLVSASHDGEIRVWQGPKWWSKTLESKVVRPPYDQNRGDFERAQIATFYDDRHLIYSRFMGNNTHQLVVHDLMTSETTLLRVAHEKGVEAIAIGRNGRWSSTDGAGNVWIWNGVLSQDPVALRPYKRVARSLTFGKDNYLAIVHTNEIKNKSTAIELWDTSRRVNVGLVAGAEFESINSAAFDSSGSLLLTHQDDSNAVVVHTVFNTDGQLVSSPLAARHQLITAGVGETKWSVAFSDDNTYRVGYLTKRASHSDFNRIGIALTEREPSGAFDFSTMLPSEDLDITWRGPDADNGGLRVERTFDNTSNTHIDITGAGLKTRISMHYRDFGVPTCYCWIPDKSGIPKYIAIGTDNVSGVFVFALGPDPYLVRYFRDHFSDVNSIGSSKDGKYLVSCARDQTIKIWSLNGISSPSAVFPRSRAWGGEFVLRNGKVVLANVDPAGILAGRGYANGDEITAVRVAPRNQENVETSVPIDIFKLLNREDVPITSSALISASRNGGALAQKVVTPAWEPVVTLFIDVRGEWAAWTPHGFYEASVGEGNELFGWQKNRGAGVTPQIFTAAELQKEFHRPQMMRQLLAIGNVPAAMAGDPQPVQGDLKGHIVKVATQVPDVTIVEPLGSRQVQEGEPIKIVARVEYANAESVAAFPVKAFNNTRSLGAPDVQIQGNVRTYTWTSAAFGTLNHLKVRADQADNEGVGLFKLDEVTIKATVKPRHYKLHYLAFGVSNYEGKVFKKLDSPVDDIKDLLDIFDSHKGQHYEIGIKPKSIFDKNVTLPTVRKAISDVCKQLENADPHDLLVVQLAGHGIAKDREYYFIPSNVDSSDDQVLRERGISGQEFVGLGDLPCAKVILLDTCYSGKILDTVGNAVQRFKNKAFMVVAASRDDQEAQESRLLGHGVFTHCLMLGLKGQGDTSKDGNVALMELANFVKDEVPRLSVKGADNRKQRPTFTPSSYFRDVDMPLVKVKAK